jgi:hypothetical protein
MYKKVSFLFSVSLSDGTPITEELQPIILEWYYDYGASNADSSMLDVELNFIDSDIIECSYVIKNNNFDTFLRKRFFEVYHDSIADPDEDGNYPLEINGNVVSIYGKVKDIIFTVSPKTSL